MPEARNERDLNFQNASLLGLSLLRSRVRGACKNRLGAAWRIAELSQALTPCVLPRQRRFARASEQCLFGGIAPAQVLPSSGNRGGSPSRLFRRYLGPQPRSATGLQASPLRDGSTVTERAHHAGAVPLARLLTRLSVSAPSGSFSVALTRRPVVSGADGRGHRVHAGVERGPLHRQPDQLIGGRELRDRPSQVRQEAAREAP